MAEARQPVQTSAVYLLKPRASLAEPPPSPPSPPLLEIPNDAEVPRISLDAYSARLEVSEPPLQTTADSADESFSSRLNTAIHVLQTEAAALQALARLYTLSRETRVAFDHAVSTIVQATAPTRNGKVIFSGVGKSGIIARKLAATFTSLSIPSIFLHPTEALHGDLGIVLDGDVLVLVSFSGATSELVALLPHISPAVKVVVISGHTSARPDGRCRLEDIRPNLIILTASVHELETTSFGVAAPMTSTTAAIAVGDALALVVGQERCQAKPGRIDVELVSVFQKNHPGGAIGAAAISDKKPTTIRDIAVPWTAIPIVESQDHLGKEAVLALDVLRTAYASSSGWVRSSDGLIFAPSRIRRLSSACLLRPVGELQDFGLRKADMMSVHGDCSVDAARELTHVLLRSMGSTKAGLSDMAPDSLVIAVLDDGDMVCGMIELSTLLLQQNELAR